MFQLHWVCKNLSREVDCASSQSLQQVFIFPLDFFGVVYSMYACGAVKGSFHISSLILIGNHLKVISTKYPIKIFA